MARPPSLWIAPSGIAPRDCSARSAGPPLLHRAVLRQGARVVAWPRLDWLNHLLLLLLLLLLLRAPLLLLLLQH